MTSFFKRLFALTDKGAKDLVKSIWCCTISNIVLMMPLGIVCMLIKEFCNPIIDGSDYNVNLGLYIVLCLISLILIFITQYVQYNATFLSSYTESANQRVSLAEHIRKLPLSFFSKKDLSDLTISIMNDCADIETALSHFLPNIFGSCVYVVIVGIFLFILNVKMAIALLWVVPVAVFIVVLTKKLQDTSRIKTTKTKMKYNSVIQEYLENIKDIKSINQSEKYLNNIDAQLNEFEKNCISSETVTGIVIMLSQMILKIGIASTILMGSILLVNGSLDIFTFIIFIITSSRIYDALIGSLQSLSATFSVLLSVERMRDINEQPIQVGSKTTMPNNYDIQFKDVHFSYDEKEEDVLNGVSFDIKQGQVTALVGTSGGGKSTIAKLISRFWDINQGEITLGGENIKSFDIETYLTKFSMVFQDVTLFNDTVMENIRIGNVNATDDEVIRIAKLTQCDEFISKLPNGYKTVIGENGSMLSGGERQRISIARAMLKNAPVILLDEATASLDVENETLIQSAISNLIDNKTVVIIAHRMRTIMSADKVIVLSNGKVVESGTPNELLAKGGMFSNMVKLQTVGKDWSIM